MEGQAPIFDHAGDTDAALAQEVADRVMLSLAPEWVSGMALNARLMQHHLDILRGADVERR